MQEMDLLHLLSSLFEEELDAANSSVSLYEVPPLLSPKLGTLERDARYPYFQAAYKHLREANQAGKSACST